MPNCAPILTTLNVSEETCDAVKQPYMGVSEVAAYFDVTRQAVFQWKARRRGFPAPAALLKMGPVWATDEIVKFKQRNNRRPRKLNVREMAERGIPLVEIAKAVLRVRGMADSEPASCAPKRPS